MKLKVQQCDLTDALESVIGGLDGRGSTTLASVLFYAADGTLTLTTTNNEMACRATVPVATGEAGAALLPGHTLHAIVKALPNVPIDLQVHNSKATLIAGSARYTLAGIPPDQFPDVPDPDITQDIQLDAALLRGILRRTLYAIGQASARFTLHGLYLELSGGLLTAVGTDGHRLVVEQWDVPAAGGMAWSGIIPKRALQLVAKRLDGAETVSLGLSYGRLFHAAVGSFQLSSRLIEGTYPNWRALAPKRPSANALTVSRNEVMGAIKRAGLIAESGLLTLEYGEAGGVVTAKSPEHGEAIEELHASYVGDGFRTGFQTDYLDGVAICPDRRGDRAATRRGHRRARDCGSGGAPDQGLRHADPASIEREGGGPVSHQAA